MKDALEIKKALLQSLIGSLKDGEGSAMKSRPAAEPKMEEECDTEEEMGEAEELDVEDEDTLAQLKKMLGV